MRLPVTLVLVALTATGPSVCCCTAATVSRAALGHSHPTAGVPKQGPHRSCCPAHNRKPVTAAPGKPEGRPAAQQPERPGRAPDDRSCPCQEQPRTPVLTAVGQGDFRQSPGPRVLSAWFLLPVDPMLSPGCHAGGAGVTSLPGPRLPFLSVDERLCAHHALRC